VWLRQLRKGEAIVNAAESRPTTVTPSVIRVGDTALEVWSGKRIQHGNETADTWQSELKTELRQAFLRLDVRPRSLLAGHYNSTSAALADTENSLFTNMNETMPSALFTALRFERGVGTPPPPPKSIDLVSGHLHYYRYTTGGSWTTWEPDQTLARWQHVPRRISIGTDTARPVWFALRQANANGLVSIFANKPVAPTTNFGVRITVHTTPTGSHRPTSNSEFVIDGAIAAFHDDPLSDALTTALVPRLPTVTEPEFRHAMSYLAGPLFPTPAVRISTNGTLQISPADDRCWLGEYTIARDSQSRWPEVSGELFTIRRREPPAD
jgi:hypothetical protein